MKFPKEREDLIVFDIDFPPPPLNLLPAPWVRLTLCLAVKTVRVRDSPILNIVYSALTFPCVLKDCLIFGCAFL